MILQSQTELAFKTCLDEAEQNSPYKHIESFAFHINRWQGAFTFTARAQINKRLEVVWMWECAEAECLIVTWPTNLLFSTVSSAGIYLTFTTLLSLSFSPPSLSLAHSHKHTPLHLICPTYFVHKADETIPLTIIFHILELNFFKQFWRTPWAAQETLGMT